MALPKLIGSGSMRLILLISLLATLSACAIDRDIGRARAIPYNAERVEMMIATTRNPIGAPEEYGRERSEISYASYTVSIPPNHRPGNIEWPRDLVPDPREAFTIAGSQKLSKSEFQSSLSRRIASKPATEQGVFLFIHGYNKSFAESLYANAQIFHDYKNPLVPLHFSWSSAARTGLYAYDQDSALFARASLTQLLSELANSRAKRLEIIAHSMGAFLLMEALRQLPEPDLARLRARMGNITLLSPDLDIDVFTSQLNAIAPPPKPFYVITSRKDLILQLSTFLRGGSRRLGLGTEDFEQLRALGVEPVDVTEFSDGRSLNHSTFNNPKLISLVVERLRRIRRGRINPGTLGTFITGAR